MKKNSLLSLFLERLTYTIFFNLLFGGFLYYSGVHEYYWSSLIFSQCVGISSYLSVWALCLFCEDIRADWGWFQGITGSTIGATFGTIAGFMLTDLEANISTIIHSDKFYLLVALGIWLGLTGTYFFLSQDKMFYAREELHLKKIHILENEKNLIALQLNALQAQIEPHFLFNTLSNILSLIETNPQRSHAMLERFTLYLRGSLDSTRENTIQLAEEVKNVAAYLDVIKFRMGDRLKINIDIPDELHQTEIPPMLLLNLVENSIKHGLEPKIEGGSIKVMAEKNNTSIIIIIEDTGMGIQGDNDHNGIGLTNTRERLALFSHNNAKMSIEQNQPQGTRIIISLPADYYDG